MKHFIMLVAITLGLVGPTLSYPSSIVEPFLARMKRSSKGGLKKEYLKIREAPPQIITAEESESIILQCSAGGNPSPTMYWMKDGHIITKDAFVDLQEKMIETNSLTTVPTGPTISSTVSRLFLDCLTPEHEGVYACVAETDLRQEKTNTVLTIHRDTSDKVCSRSLGPRLEQWTSMQGTMQGSTATLLCRAENDGLSTITWYDPEGNKITSGKKYTVMGYGDLKIHDLDWTDMGQFKCKVTSKFGEEEREVFLYPFAPESSTV